MAISVPRVYAAIEKLYEPGRTVVAAGSLVLGARIAQEKLGITLASVHLAPSMFRSIDLPPVLPGLFMPALVSAPAKRLLFWMGDVAGCRSRICAARSTTSAPVWPCRRCGACSIGGGTRRSA